VQGIPFRSLCEHHALPFIGRADVGYLLRAEHMCMTLRGAQVAGTTTVTSALHGLLLDDGRDPGVLRALPYLIVGP
jgi:GTP cyclohydrolase I